MFLKKRKKQCFTLVELMISMSVFAVLMLILMRIFGSMQDVWRKTGSKAESYESVRIAIDLIENDFMNMVYVADLTTGRCFCYSKDTNKYTMQVWDKTKKKYKDENIEPLQDIWLPIKRTYQDDNHEVTYELEKIPKGTNEKYELFKLKYKDVVSNNSFLSSNATTSNPEEKGVFLENICSFSIVPFDKNGALISAGCTNNPPVYVMIKISILDDDDGIKERYKKNGDPNLIRTFRRLIIIPQTRGL